MYLITISLLSAFSVSIADFLTKKYLKNDDIWVVYWVRMAYAVPFLLIYHHNMYPVYSLPSVFWFTVIPLVIIETLAGVLYAKSIQISPLSLTIPFMAFTPVFLLFVGYFAIGEVPSLTGTAGVLMVALGAYTLNVHHAKNGVLEPIFAVFKEKGSWMMLLTAGLYSLSAAYCKKAMMYTGNPLFFASFYITLISLSGFPAMFCLSGFKLKIFFKKPVLYIAIGFFMAVMNLTSFIALNGMHASYMISVKRLSVVFSVILGALFLKEERLTQNLLACIMMVLGVVLIAVSK